MAKINFQYRIKNIDSVFNAVESVFRESVGDSVTMDRIGKFFRDRIVAETRKGKDLVREDRQPELSDGYVAYRRRLVSREKKQAKAVGKALLDGGSVDEALKVGNITEKTPVPDGTFFSPGRSNLTLTGQLLNSIDYRIIVSQKTIIIEPTGTRNDGLTNKEVASELARRKTRNAPGGRLFLGIDDRGFKRIRALIVEEIRRIALRKGF